MTGLREKLNLGQESMASFFKTRVWWWFDDIQWHTSPLVGQLSPAKKFEIAGQEAVKSHLTIMNNFRSGKPRFKGMERCRFCLSRSVLPTGKRHHAQSAITDGKNCAGKSPEFCHQFFIAQQCNILLAVLFSQFFLQYGCRSLYILLSKPCFYTEKQNHLLSSN